MRKATATYHAPEGDNKVVEMGGVTFFDGQEVELNSDDHGHMINKLPNNPQVQYHVGMAYRQAGDTESARKALELAVKSPASFIGKDEARTTLAGLK